MNLNRFKECSAAFGAQRRRWPEREQPHYDHFAGTVEGAVILAEAERTDRFLDSFEPAAPDRRLVRRIAALSKPTWRRFGAPAAALLASGILGFVLGFVQARDAADANFAAELLLGPHSSQELGL